MKGPMVLDSEEKLGQEGVCNRCQLWSLVIVVVMERVQCFARLQTDGFVVGEMQF